MSGNVLLPLSTEIPQRIITIKDLHGNANISSITIKTQGSDIFDTGLTQSMLSNSYDSRTFYACSTGCWYLISQAVTPLSLTLSNNLFVGNTTVLSNTLTVGGTAAFSNTTSFGGTGTFSNNVGVLGTLNVGKAAVLSNTLQVNGNIGIGTSPSPSYAVYANGDLVVFSAGSMGLINPGTSLRISASNASGSAPANIVLNGSGGNVGIGVANPAHTLDILGSLRVSGNILGVLGQTSAYNVNAWYSSVDTVARFYFGNNGPTYFGTGNGEYYWRQTINSGLNNMSLDNNGNLSVRGNLTVGGATPTSAMSITGDINCSGKVFGLLGGNLSISTYSWEPRIFNNNWWYCSAEGKPRIYCMTNSCTYFGSGDGTFRFQNDARNRDNVVITNGGVMIITGTFNAPQADLGGATIARNLYVYGSIYAEGDITALSDERHKENIETVDSALEKINSLRGVYYTRKDFPGIRKLGVIAQEVEEVIPEVISTDDTPEKKKSVAYGNMVGLLIEGMKEQQKIIKAQQSTLDFLLSVA